MASFSRREVVTRTVEYAIPSGDAMGEFNKAYVVAEQDYRQRNNKGPGDHLYDDWAHVYARDDEVVIAFEIKGRTDE